MRYALVSDLHANWQAWKATLLDIRSVNADAIICLGDIVGYGPSPAEVLQSVHAEIEYFVLGNHDAVIAGKMDPSRFNEDARSLIEWTRAHLGEAAVRFLGEFPLTLLGDGFRCTHSEFSQPGAFRYVIDPQDARPSWTAVSEPILFVGHTHQPGMFVQQSDGTMEAREPSDIVLADGNRYLINVGSVGQPRDGDPRGCYVLFDTEARSVTWRRIPFDLDAYRATLRHAGLPERSSYFLIHDPRRGRPPLRDMLTFMPARTEEEAVRDVVPVRSLQVAERRAKRWKWAALVTAATFVAGAGITVGMLWREATRCLRLVGPNFEPRLAERFGAETNVLPALMPTPSPNTPIPGWEVRLGDKRRQSMEVCAPPGGDLLPPGKGNLLHVRSSSLREICFSAPPIPVQRDMRFMISAFFHKSDDFHGTVQLEVWTQKPDGSHLLVALTPNISRKGGWLQARRTFDVPAGTKNLQLRIRGAFTGKLLCQDPSLSRK